MSERPFDQDEALDRALRQALAPTAPPQEHPALDELLDYHQGALPPEEAERIQAHLGRCAECARLVLDFAAFSDPEASHPEVPEPELEREWAQLQARRASAAAARSRITYGSWALAASLLLSLGLFGWVLALRHRLAQSDAPRADAISAYLQAEGSGTLRAGQAPFLVSIPPAIGWVSLSLSLGDARTDSVYRIELRTSGGRLAWSSREVPRGVDGTFSLQIPAKLLPPDEYRLRLFGAPRSEGTETLAADYRFRTAPAKPILP